MNFAELSQSIRAARKAQQLTQTQVSDAAGVSRKTLSSLETGKISDIGLRKLLAICTLLNLEFALQAVTLGANRYPTLQQLRAAQ